jgi:outer membrane receptor protein involved in Fe transport
MTLSTLRRMAALCCLGGFLALVLGGLLAPKSYGQVALGGLTGYITDSGGAAIADANVSVINEATQGRRVAPTNANGTFQVDGLQVGTYTVEIEHSGFKKYVQSGIPVTPGQIANVDVVLQLGAIAQTVDVKDVVPLLHTDSSSLTTHIPTVVYAEKPIVDQSRQNYLFDAVVWQPGSASGNGGYYSLAGNRISMQSASVEGLVNSVTYVRPPYIGIQETNTIYSNPPAEYARPANITATFKSGTNVVHGEWMRNYLNPCTNARNTPFSHPTLYPCPPSWRDQVAVGGPIYIPKVYDGRNKSFLFFAIKRNPIWSANPVDKPLYPTTESIPTIAMQGGDFSQYPKTIKDPTTGLPFPGNVIPSNRITQMAKVYAATYFGNKAIYSGGPNNFVNNAYYLGSRYSSAGDTKMVRFDQNVGVKGALSISFMHEVNGSTIASQANPTPQTVTGELLKTWTPSLGYTYTFTPYIINQLRVGLYYFLLHDTLLSQQGRVTFYNQSTPVKGADVVQSYGLQGIAPSTLSGEPAISIASWPSIPTGGTDESTNIDERATLSDNLSLQHGRHTFKVGYSALKQTGNGTSTNLAQPPGPYFGAFTFNGTFTGDGWADFLLGLPSTSQRFTTRGDIGLNEWQHGVFAQDEFRVNSRLNLQLGLRYDIFEAPYDRNGLYYNFDPKTFSVVVPSAYAAQHVSAAWPSSTFPVITAAAAHFPSRLVNGSGQLAPRFGFAYRLTHTMVLRGGYGIYTGNLRYNYVQTNGPFAPVESYTNQATPGVGSGALYSMPNPFPAMGQANILTITGYNVHYHAPYTQNWNVSLERELPGNWGLSASYRGVHAVGLPYVTNLNAVQASTVPFSQSRLPYPKLGNINYIINGADDKYNAVIVQTQHPFTKGMYFVAAYTYSHAYTDAPTASSAVGFAGADDQAAYTPEYTFNVQRDWGRDSTNPAQDFIGSYVVELPFGHGKRFAGEANKVVNSVIGNWSFSGAVSWRSGWFFTPVLNGVDPGNIGNTASRRPNLVPGCDPYGGAQNIHALWFNPSCFTTAPNGQLGDVAPGSLTGPGAWTVIMNPFKDFPLDSVREGMKLRFGAEIFNLFNHPVYGVPNTNLSSPTAGLITSIAPPRGSGNDYSGSRSIIFTMRFIF